MPAMPDIEQTNDFLRWVRGRFEKSEHAWLTGHFGPMIDMPGDVIGGSISRCHYASTATINWERKVRRDPDDTLPRCLLGHPPQFQTSYFAPTDAGSARERHLALLDFYDSLNDAKKSAALWRKLRKLCQDDDLAYQFRASSLVRIALAGVAGIEEQWNGPQARKLFTDVKEASRHLRTCIEAASRVLQAPPSKEGITADIVRGRRPPYTTEEIEALSKAKDDIEEHEVSPDENESQDLYDDQLDRGGALMRQLWQQFWNFGPGLSFMCANFEKKATEVEVAWADARNFNAVKDSSKRKVGYLMSRVCIHLNDRFPANEVSALAGVCQELVELAYPGEDRLNASQKFISRLRSRGQNAKK